MQKAGHFEMQINNVGIGVTTLVNQTDIFGNGGMGWTGPLTVNNLAEMTDIGQIGELQNNLHSLVGILEILQVLNKQSIQPLPAIYWH